MWVPGRILQQEFGGWKVQEALVRLLDKGGDTLHLCFTFFVGGTVYILYCFPAAFRTLPSWTKPVSCSFLT